MDKSWMKITNRRSQEYLNGIQQFLNFASNHAHPDGTISCPCRKCVHKNLWPIDVIQAYLVSKGIYRGYKSIHSKCGICAKCYNIAHLTHQTPKTELYQMC